MKPTITDCDTVPAGDVRRRRFLALGASVGATVLAGCASESGMSPGSGDGSTSTPSDGETGTFRLLISDQPVAIDEFDELNVSFDRARIFRGDGNGDETETSPTETATSTPTPEATPTGTPTTTDTETPPEDEGGDSDGSQRGFVVIDLGGATVDLTQVVGEKAIDVFEGGLEAGRYTKIELYAQRVEGIVDGAPVDVKIPSGKLQIVKPFEVVAGETVSFVFDINVVKKGQSGGYNLLPVIAKSGVAGQDVEVEEVGTETGAGTNESAGTDGTATAAPDGAGGTGTSQGDGGGPQNGQGGS